MRVKPVVDIYLNYFLKYSKSLEGLYLVKTNEYSKEWIAKKKFLAKQALALYKYANELLINKFYDYDKEKKEESRYYFFLLDMIYSKLKRSIFTETPKTEIFDVYTFIYKEDLAFTGERLREYGRDDKLFDIEFQRFIFKSFLMFDFIYYKDDGIFTRYELNRELFEEAKKNLIFKREENEEMYKIKRIKALKNLFKKKSTSKNKEDKRFREFGYDVIKKVLEANLNYYGVNFSNVYEKIVSDAKNGKIYKIEPFSYYLANKLWKYSRIIQSTLEFSDKEKQKEQRDRFIELVQDYIDKTLKSIDLFYKKEIDNLQLFEKFYELDKKILNSEILNGLLPKYDEKKIDFSYNYKITDYIKKNQNKKDLTTIIQATINNKKYKKYKFIRLLENSNITVDDITLLAQSLVKDEKFEGEFDLIGMFGSGVLPAHIINITKNLNKLVYMFSPYPYISILPRTNTSKNSKNIVIDESIKSGFSFRLFAIYKKKLLKLYKKNHNFSYKLFSFVDIVDYEKNEDEYNYKTLAKLKVENKELKIDYVQENIDEQLFNWKDFFEKLPDINKNEFKKTVTVKYKIERKDITRLLAVSKYYFQIAKTFAKQIHNDNNSDTIILHSTTDEGKSLCYATAFAYKALYNDKNIILNKEDAQESVKKGKKVYFIDMSCDTMFTIKRCFEMDFNDNKEELNSLKKAFVIYASEEAEKNLGNKIYFIDKLREVENV